MIDTSYNPKKLHGEARGERRYLIVNADDFGLSSGVNKGILECHMHGLVTSASLMVRGAAAQEATSASRVHTGLSVGLHLDLGEWSCIEGDWHPVYEVVPTDDAVAVEHELRHQLEAFRRLMGRDPSHLDSHQHVHRDASVRQMVLRMGKELGVPVRHFTSPVRYCGNFYGQTGDGKAFAEGISVEKLVHLIENLSLGITEIGCHPGYADSLETMYRNERRQEIEALCSIDARNAIIDQRIELISFSQVNRILSER